MALKLRFVQQNGVEKTIGNAEPGQSLMTLARDSGVEGIFGDCGGCWRRAPKTRPDAMAKA